MSYQVLLYYEHFTKYTFTLKTFRKNRVVVLLFIQAKYDKEVFCVSRTKLISINEQF